MSRFKEIEGYNNDYFITEDGDMISVNDKIAKMFDVSKATIINICKNRIYT